MFYLRYEKDNQKYYGVLEGRTVKQLGSSYFGDLEYTGKEIDVDKIKILPPCIPSKIIAVGLNYHDHIRELGNKIPENPTLFIKLSHTVIGHLDEIILPKGHTRVDYEAEMAAVIKKECIDVNEEDALEYIFGVTCLNDVTERDIQKKDGQWTRSKNYNTFCPVGPFICDGIDYADLPIRSYLNGVVKQDSNTSDMIWQIPYLISFISKVIPLYPQDIVTTGTPFGVSPMKHGDVIEIEIEGVGRLKNTVVSQ